MNPRTKKMRNAYIGSNKTCKYCKCIKGNHHHELKTKSRKIYNNFINKKSKCRKCVTCPRGLHFHK